MEYDINSGLFVFDASEAALVAGTVSLKSITGPNPLSVYKVTKLEIEAMDRTRKNLDKYPVKKREEFERNYQERVRIVKILKPALEEAMTALSEEVKQKVLE